MRKLILLAVLLFGITLNTSLAQLTFQKFKATDGLSTARTVAIDSGLVNPKLIAIGAMSGQVPLGTFNVDMEIDSKNGTATAWLYVFRSSGPDNKLMAFGVIKLFIYISMSVPVSMLSDFPLSPEDPLPEGWKDSPEMVNLVTNHDDYKAFIAANPEANIDLCGLGINRDNPLLTLGDPYWLAIARAGEQNGSITCFVHAISGETSCITLSSVEWQTNSNDIIISPNPAEQFLNLQLPNDWVNKDMQITITDYSGKMILKSGLDAAVNELGMASISIENYTKGIYFIIFNNANANFVKSFIKN